MNSKPNNPIDDITVIIGEGTSLALHFDSIIRFLCSTINNTSVQIDRSTLNVVLDSNNSKRFYDFLENIYICDYTLENKKRELIEQYKNRNNMSDKKREQHRDSPFPKEEVDSVKDANESNDKNKAKKK